MVMNRYFGPNQRPGTANYLGTVGKIVEIARVSSIGHIGSVQLKSGTLGRVQQVGSMGAARYVSTYVWSQVGGYKGTMHLGAGTPFVGSWREIAPFRIKTVSARNTAGGTLNVVTGAVGTTFPRQTGTYVSQRLGPGSFVQVSFTEAFTHVKVLVRGGGKTAGGGGTTPGTLWLSLTGQP